MNMKQMKQDHAEMLFDLLIIYGVDYIKSVVDKIYETQKKQECADFTGLRSLGKVKYDENRNIRVQDTGGEVSRWYANNTKFNSRS